MFQHVAPPSGIFQGMFRGGLALVHSALGQKTAILFSKDVACGAIASLPILQLWAIRGDDSGQSERPVLPVNVWGLGPRGCP